MFNHNCSPFLTRLFSCFWQVCSQRVWTKESKSSFSFFLFLDWNYWNDNGVIENYDEVGECIFSFLLKFLCFLLSLCDWIKGSKRRRASRHPGGGGGVKSSVETMFFFAFHNENYETVTIYQIMFSQRMSNIRLWKNFLQNFFFFTNNNHHSSYTHLFHSIQFLNFFFIFYFFILYWYP